MNPAARDKMRARIDKELGKDRAVCVEIMKWLCEGAGRKATHREVADHFGINRYEAARLMGLMGRVGLIDVPAGDDDRILFEEQEVVRPDIEFRGTTKPKKKP